MPTKLTICFVLLSLSSSIFALTATEKLINDIKTLRACLDILEPVRQEPQKLVIPKNPIAAADRACTAEEISKLLEPVKCHADRQCQLSKLVKFPDVSSANLNHFMANEIHCTSARHLVSDKCRLGLGFID